ncbi:MAG: hypothetical protein NVSMB5_16970 [Candidatus Velthaea sp.]
MKPLSLNASCSETAAKIVCVVPRGFAHDGIGGGVVVESDAELHEEYDTSIGAKSPLGTVYHSNPSYETVHPDAVERDATMGEVAYPGGADEPGGGVARTGGNAPPPFEQAVTTKINAVDTRAWRNVFLITTHP